ncbi:hypothetical protein AMTRI_Chr03g56380 [Amborella trichopoda]
MQKKIHRTDGKFRNPTGSHSFFLPERAMSLFRKFLFPPPSSLFVNAMSFIGAISLCAIGFGEIRGKHLNYSKFWRSNPEKNLKKENSISSTKGMLTVYTPAFVASMVSFGFIEWQLRPLLLSSTLALHFCKRIVEVLFVHRYSGGMMLDTSFLISLSYFLSSVTMIYSQSLTPGHPEPALDLKYIGVPLFLLGITGNFYHHYLLSKLRKNQSDGYKIPSGGLFGLAVCPHYLFEILGFVGVTFIAQTLYALAFTLGTISYLMGRSYATRKWYLAHFKDFPRERKALIPYIF